MEKEMIQQALQRYMEDTKLSLKSVGEMVGASHTSVMRWLNGGKIRGHHWEKLRPLLEDYTSSKEPENNVPFQIKEAYALLKRAISNKHLTWLVTQNLRNTINTFEEIEQERPPKTENKIIQFEVAENSLPYQLQQVSAGNGIEVLEERYSERQDMSIIEVHGDSMTPTYSEGEKIIVQLFQERIIFGDDHLPIEIIKNIIPEDSIIIYNMNDSGLAMKRVKYENRGKTWYFKLYADNPEFSKLHNFPKIIRMKDDFIVYGKVIGKQK